MATHPTPAARGKSPRRQGVKTVPPITKAEWESWKQEVSAKPKLYPEAMTAGEISAKFCTGPDNTRKHIRKMVAAGKLEKLQDWRASTNGRWRLEPVYRRKV